MNNHDSDVFDADEFRAQFESVALRKQLISLFPGETLEYLARARDALAAGNAKALHLAAHALKGTVGAYLGTRAFSATAELCRLALDKNLAAAAEALAKCEEEIEILGQALKQFSEETS